MTNELLNYLLVAVTTFSVTTSLLLFWRSQQKEEFPRRPRRHYREEEFDGEEQSEEIMDEALRKAKKTLSQAELEGVELVAKIEAEKKKIEGDYYHQVGALVEEISRDLRRKTAEAQAAYVNLIESLGQRVEADLKGSQEIYRQKLDELVTDKTQSLENFLSSLKERTDLTQDLFGQMKENLKSRAQEAEEAYGDFLKSLETRVSADLVKRQEILGQKIDDFFGKTETLLGSFVKDLQGKTALQLDKEIGSAKRLIDEYKLQRMGVIDENIVAILEKTLNIALAKKLSLADQTALVYEALEEAKKEGFFV